MQQNDLTVIYLCNAVDELTKKERHVRFDSPAATNKVIGVGKALQAQNVKVFILSLGRGKQTGDGRKFPSVIRDIFGIPILYAAFWHYPLLTHIIGAFSLSALFMRLLRNHTGRIVVVAYNRLWHYLPTLVLAALFRKPCYIDLEDGAIESKQCLTRIVNLISRKLFDFFCNEGALIAAKSLKEQLNTKRVFICYGCTEIVTGTLAKWSKKPLQILFGGSLLVETGVQLLIDTINILRRRDSHLKDLFKVSVTGRGRMAEQLANYSNTDGKGWINFIGDVDREAYVRILNHSHIGLCLKLSSSQMGKTTFPSKIIEYASYGLLIISTKVSDVPDLLNDDSAILLPDETPECLADAIFKIINNADYAESLAKQGQQRVHSVCNYETVGLALKNFLFSGFGQDENC